MSTDLPRNPSDALKTRERRPLNSLIPSGPAPHADGVTPAVPASGDVPNVGAVAAKTTPAAGQALAALAAVQRVTVHVGVLQAAAALLEDHTRAGDDMAKAQAMAATAAVLRDAGDGLPAVPASASPAERAMAALAVVRTTAVHVGVLQAAVVLLEDQLRLSEGPARDEAITATVAALREAIEHARG
ncbi:hypothetical protein [Streptomyces sp. NPDC020667]|uniref:hypothetical protein n=1 Tax=Streptomyces sp. NPDC020667 TaxID=3154895 RepID=UPI0033E7AFDD